MGLEFKDLVHQVGAAQGGLHGRRVFPAVSQRATGEPLAWPACLPPFPDHRLTALLLPLASQPSGHV